jgi:hypothetical protein
LLLLLACCELLLFFSTVHPRLFRLPHYYYSARRTLELVRTRCPPDVFVHRKIKEKKRKKDAPSHIK